ncbi:MAG: histidine kinase dimerization/phospho-acceptor domain-containing protein, partial [Pacificimonas sp.]
MGGLLSMVTGWAIGADQPVIAVVAAVILLIVLPGLIDSLRTPEPAEDETGAGDASPAPQLPDIPMISLEDLHDAAFLLTPDGNVLAANMMAIDMLGGATGEHVRLVLRQPAALDLVETALLDRREVAREVEGLGRQGNVYMVRAMPTGSNDLLVTLADISPARLAERTRTDFVANASHELRTPLASVTGFIETLQGPAADDEEARTRFLAVMADEAARMTRLIDDLLSLSRAELDKNIRPRTPIAITALLHEFAATMQQMPGKLNFDIEDDLPLVLGNADQLLQVLGNLVT